MDNAQLEKGYMSEPPVSNNQQSSVLQGIMGKTQQSEQSGRLMTPKVEGKKAGTGQPPLPAQSARSKKDETPFDFRFIKIIIKRSSEATVEEVLLERDWVQKDNTIPHFANVIKNVDASEGIEITMNCNKKAFEWIIEYVRVRTDGEQTITEKHRAA